MVLLMASIGGVVSLGYTQNKGNVDMNHEKSAQEQCAGFQRRYFNWVKRVNEMSPYSKSTAYTRIPEYRSIVAMGKIALPCLVEKLEKDENMDFLLCDAVIEISGWQPEEFPATDVGARRDAVLRKMQSTIGHSPPP